MAIEAVARLSIIEQIALLAPVERERRMAGMSAEALARLRCDGRFIGRPAQMAPPGDWFTWLIMAGRGFGKTRAGAEWVRSVAERDGMARIALVGASLHEARSIMVEGESGLLAITPADNRPMWQPALRQLTWRNGARATIFGAADPEALRGPQHSHGWADEIGKWPRGVQAWDNLVMGLRLGERPRIVATTTPRPVALVRKLVSASNAVTTRGRTMDNLTALPEPFLAQMARDFAGTRLGRQELEGELLLDNEGALWTRDMLDACRLMGAMPAPADLVRIVIGVDPPAGSHGDACGIIVVALDRHDGAVVLEDATVERASPQRWARAVAHAAERWNADKIVAEANNGGEMVGAVLKAADIALPVRLVHASRGKSARAEPIAVAYEAGRVKHAGMLGALEDQLCGMIVNGGYEGPGRSPDRADALVWCLTEILLTRAPRVQLRQL